MHRDARKTHLYSLINVRLIQDRHIWNIITCCVHIVIDGVKLRHWDEVVSDCSVCPVSQLCRVQP